MEITEIHKTDPDFPRRLLRIGEDCPEVIFCRGNLDLLKQHYRVAIIGARAADRQGCGAAYRLGQVWAQQGYVVVSGLALGCDIAAHWGRIGAYLQWWRDHGSEPDAKDPIQWGEFLYYYNRDFPMHPQRVSIKDLFSQYTK